MEATFRNCNLENADFRFSDLGQVKFDNVNLKGADFRLTDLNGVSFARLDVRGANFTRAMFVYNFFYDRSRRKEPNYSVTGDFLRDNFAKSNTEDAKFDSYLETYSATLKGGLFDSQYYYEPGYE